MPSMTVQALRELNEKLILVQVWWLVVMVVVVCDQTMCHSISTGTL